jgi:hypothetical protein
MSPLYYQLYSWHIRGTMVFCPDLPTLSSHLLALVLHPEASCEPSWNNEGLISLAHAHRVALGSHRSFSVSSRTLRELPITMLFQNYLHSLHSLISSLWVGVTYVRGCWVWCTFACRCNGERQCMKGNGNRTCPLFLLTFVSNLQP